MFRSLDSGFRPHRRWILWTLLSALLIALGPGCAHREPERRFEFQRPQMGLPFRMILYSRDADQAARVAEAVWGRIAELNAILSDYDENSELSRLSRSAGSGQRLALSPELATVLAEAERISRISDGAFDVTVGPYVQLWKRARRQRELPAPERLAAARAAVGWQFVKLEHQSDPLHPMAATLLRPDMRLDLGGIAKGYALAEGARRIRQLGVRRFLISGGGDMVVGDAPPGEPGWRVEVAALDVPGAPPPKVLRLRHAALVTSGDFFQRAEIGGIRYSHIVDPRTGIGLTDHSLVTLVGREAMTVDAVSKLVAVLGPDRGLDLLRREFPGVEGLVVRQPGAVIERRETPGFRRWEERR